MWFLQMRLMMLVGLLFAVIYAVIAMIGTYLGFNDLLFYLILAFGVMCIQYLLGPTIVGWTMRVRYVQRKDYPRLFQIVESLAVKAEIPMPRVCIAQIALPNAFAFGRSIRDGRVCVTEGLLGLLNEEELKAVLGHEMSHLKNRDVLTITLLSVIPMVLYWIYWRFTWAPFYGRSRSERSSNSMVIGMAAFLFYLVANLLVLYGSRIREYFADRGSVMLGNQPSSLASALYKLVYGAARLDKQEISQVEGLKAFFASDPSQALNQIRELKDLDLDRSGTIEPSELDALSRKKIDIGLGARLLELYSTHPNMLKRIKQLSTYRS